MDEGIGRVLAAVNEINARDNTLVVFTSDNGGERFSNMWPLVGKKMDLLEGGIRVPYIVRWPRRVDAGTTNDRLTIGMDWTPTFLAAAGVSPTQIIRSTVWTCSAPWTMNESCSGGRAVPQSKGVRTGDWKWLSIDGNEFLYDISFDERERANMRYRYPERFVEIRDAYFDWDRSMPLFPETASVALEYDEHTMAKSDG